MNTTIIAIAILLIVVGLFYLSRNKNSATMDIQTAKQKIQQDSGIIIDVRTSGEFTEGHLKKAKYNWDVMSGEFAQKLQKLDKSGNYFLYCRSGNRSGKAMSIMKSYGFENVYNIGGYSDLVKSGFESSK